MKVSVIASAFVLCISSLSPALSQAREKGGSGCREDMQKFCKDVKPGSGGMGPCLMQHEAELSPSCRSMVSMGKQKSEEIIQACNPDAERLCKGVQPGEGRLVRCMAEKKDQLSPACRQKITGMEQSHPCAADMMRLCKDVEKGGGRMRECMKQNESRLSPACKAAIGKHGEGAPKEVR